MITKVCPVCLDKFAAKNNRAKTCSRKCAVVSAKSINQRRYKTRRSAPDPVKNKGTYANLVREYLEDFVPGICLARQKWNSSFKYRKDETLENLLQQ